MSSAILSSRFRITIPPDVREHLGLKPGQWVTLTPRGGSLVLELDPATASEPLETSKRVQKRQHKT